ncbi:MAG: glycosyl hydrolase 115 family protein [Roseburia sp.]|nr:glycosyl hydrolase 115 family protein [Roseburia sp.]MCM1097114.1 glycosyl hydrolase 115 family protein [Ruminococcus flavefaciens]
MSIVFEREKVPPLVAEECAYEGVKRIAEKVAEDIRKVFGSRTELLTGEELLVRKPSCAVLCATLGKSRILEELVREGLTETSGLLREDGSPKREVYEIRRISLGREVFQAGQDRGSSLGGEASRIGQSRVLSLLPAETEELLLICGSDKRGTIYGMFSLSEYIGVSPLCFWGDAEPMRRERLVIGGDIETLSREPSVKYRGFFINDEWPCFGNWVTEHYGGFNAEAYDAVFELLLRMKGNYLWPAMWSSSFPLDGPGSRNEELADLYGVVIGYSHHEPCLRASEEWDKVRGEGSRYGNEWNFYTNEQGLLNYWEDALERSGGYENVITVGMRGERDSSMLGEQATLEENILLLKDIIAKQRERIGRLVKRESGEIPMMLALYKEVEPYFYGDGATAGLKDWDGLDGVTCMFCEDNYGYMRTLPSEEIRGRKGGFGMYYHLDYHGGPVSYEWVDSTPLSRVWEQMGEAYEYGIREIWIVNVGDLKFHEVPLSYFLALAYDYDRWGYGNPDSCGEYVRQWIKECFPAAGRELQGKAGQAFADYIRLNSLRRPEALHPGVYHPCHYGETDRMLAEAEALEELSRQVLAELPGEEADAYYSMVHFPAAASANLLKMHLYAGKNQLYAGQGRVIANRYGELVRECIRRDSELSEEWAAFREGKWNGMQLAQHIGFTRWNEDDYRYPVVMQITPAHRPRLSLSRQDQERAVTKSFGPRPVIRVTDFQYAGCERVVLEVANGGRGRLDFRITVEEPEGGLPEWLKVTPMSGDTEDLQEVTLECRRELLTEETRRVKLLIRGGDGAEAEVEISARAPELRREIRELPERVFLEQNGRFVLSAEHFSRKKDTAKGGFQVLPDYGKHGGGVKVFPSTARFAEGEEKPELTYLLYAEEAGEYRVEIVTAPSNPLANGGNVSLILTAGRGVRQRLSLFPEGFRAGEPGDADWVRAALDQERRVTATVYLDAGLQELTIGAMDAGLVLEKLLVYRAESAPEEGYLGPWETWFTGRRPLI